MKSALRSALSGANPLRCMAKRPLSIFVSSTTADLGSYRTAVRDELLHRDGVIPVLQEHFNPTFRTVRKELESKIRPCDAVICLIGKVYGEAPPDAPRESYTQLEYRVARRLRKPVFLFVAKDSCAWDQPIRQTPEETELQSNYRKEIQEDSNLYVSFTDREELRQQVGRIDFEALRPRRDWLRPLGIVLLLAAGLSLVPLLSPVPSTPIPVSLEMGSAFVEGDALEISVTTHRAGYLYLGAVWADGSVYLLYPNFHHPLNGDNLVKAGQKIRLPNDLPPAADGRVIRYPMEFPTGIPAAQTEITERIFAFVTDEPLRLPDSGDDLGPGFRKLGVLRDPASFSPDAPPDRLEFQNWNLPLGPTGVVVKNYILQRQ